MKPMTRASLFLAVALALPACGSSSDPGGGGGGGGGDIPSYRATGTVVDFETGNDIAGVATVSTTNLTPPPSITVNGAQFELDNIPPGSVFDLLVGSPPDYVSTYGATVEVIDADETGITANAISTDYLTRLADGFGVSPTSTKGILIARAITEDGKPRAGVGATAFEIDGAAPAAGPYFLDENLAAAPALTETSASGYVVFFELKPGLITVNAAAGSGYSMTMNPSPAAAAVVTLSQVVVSDGPAPPPSNVSFSGDIMPIFIARGCANCHSGGGIGKDLGGLMLDSGENKTYSEVATEISPNFLKARVDLTYPEQSLILTMPSPEDPPDAHPNVTFLGPSDPDYQMIKVWIMEGAKEN